MTSWTAENSSCTPMGLSSPLQGTCKLVPLELNKEELSKVETNTGFNHVPDPTWTAFLYLGITKLQSYK